MPYSYEMLDGGHIIIVTLHSDFDLVSEIRQLTDDGNALAEQNPAPIVYVTDGRALHFANFNAMMDAVNAVRTVKPEDRVYQHPKIIKSLTVIDNRVIQVAARGLNSVSLGNIQVTLFNTVEEALVQARALLKEAGYDDLSAAG